ncbi:hypothetical protein, partial [Streptomyces sp. NPDC002403]
MSQWFLLLRTVSGVFRGRGTLSVWFFRVLTSLVFSRTPAPPTPSSAAEESAPLTPAIHKSCRLTLNPPSKVRRK